MLFHSARLRGRSLRKKQLTHSQYMQRTLALQTGMLQLERHKVRALQAFSSKMNEVTSELLMLRTVCSTASAIQITELPVDSVQSMIDNEL